MRWAYLGPSPKNDIVGLQWFESLTAAQRLHQRHWSALSTWAWMDATGHTTRPWRSGGDDSRVHKSRKRKIMFHFGQICSASCPLASLWRIPSWGVHNALGLDSTTMTCVRNTWVAGEHPRSWIPFLKGRYRWEWCTPESAFWKRICSTSWITSYVVVAHLLQSNTTQSFAKTSTRITVGISWPSYLRERDSEGIVRVKKWIHND